MLIMAHVAGFSIRHVDLRALQQYDTANGFGEEWVGPKSFGSLESLAFVGEA